MSLDTTLTTTHHFTSRLRKPDLLALHDTLIFPRENYMECLQEFLTDIFIDKAVGKQLDGCGDILNQPRIISNAMYKTFFGYRNQPNTTGYSQSRYRRKYENAKSVSYELLDEDYRQLLKWRRHENFNRGTIPDIKKSIQLLLAVDNVVVYSENMKVVVLLQRDQVEQKIFTEMIKTYVSSPVGIDMEVRLVDKLDQNTKPIDPNAHDPDEPDWWYDSVPWGNNIGTNGSPDWLLGNDWS